MASLTELRKLNKAIGYFVPKSAVSDIELKPISDERVSAFLRNDLHEISHVLEYLKDK
jgi:hypothetical protein